MCFEKRLLSFFQLKTAVNLTKGEGVFIRSKSLAGCDFCTASRSVDILTTNQATADVGG